MSPVFIYCFTCECAVHLQVAVCSLIDMHSQVSRVIFTHSHTRGQLFGTLDGGHITQ